MNSASGTLRPRLASHFESSIAPDLPATDQVLDTGPSAVAEARQKSNIESRVAERNQTAEQTIPSTQMGQTQSGRLVPPPQIRDESAQLVRPIEGPPPPDHTEPSRTEDQAQDSPLISSPLTEHPSVSAEMRRDAHDISKAPTPLVVHTVTPQGETERDLDVRQNEDAKTTPKVHISAKDSEGSLTAASTSVMPTVERSDLGPERFQATRASRLVISNIEQKLIPIIATQGQGSQKTSPTESPTINVTIGRIEVKATAPTTAPKRGARTSSTISLDEYLRRRQAGGS